MSYSRVTVYIVTRNRSKLLIRAVKSVISQDYKNLELIVVNDDSTDDTKKVIDTLSKNFDIKLISNTTNIGPCSSRNLAILQASGEYVTGLDDDDFFSKSNRISSFYEHAKINQNSKLIFFDTATSITSDKKIIINQKSFVNLKNIRQSNYIGNQVFTKKEVYISAGLFDPLMPAWQDWDLWIRMANLGYNFKNIQLNSQVIDESHEYLRITNSSNTKIRIAKQRLESKLNHLSLYEKSSLISAMLNYKNMFARPKDLFYLLIAFRLRELFKSIKKLKLF